MPGPGKKACHILFLITVIILTVLKWHDFSLPYFWDELGVYSQAADYQFHHHLSLMPASVPPVLSRGHPLLFTFLNAAVMRIFGQQVFVSHLFCFFISLLLLWVVYIKISKYFGLVAGILSAVILAVQPLFLAQCCLVLPEILLALFVFLALCNYYENRFPQFALFASLAILTKEAAIVLPVTVIGYSIACWAAGKVKPLAFKPLALIFTWAPYLVFALFVLVQKWQNGWYFFPTHINYLAFDSRAFLIQFKHYASFVFTAQGRALLTIIWLTATLLIIVLGRMSWKSKGAGFLFLLLLLTIALLAFNSLFAIYMGRYVIMALVILSVLAGVAVGTLSVNWFFIIPITTVLIIVASRNFENGLFNYDEDLGYRRQVNTLQQATTYLYQKAEPGATVYSNFPGYFALSFPPAGYLPGKTDGWKIERSDNYYLIMCTPGDPIPGDTIQYKMDLLKRFNNGYAHVEVYWVKKI